MQKMQAIAVIVSAVVIGVVGQLFIKKALNSMDELDISRNALHAYITIFSSAYVMCGLFIYGISMLLWLYGLTKVDLSYAYPFLALSYILVIAGSWYFLGESISILRFIGVMIICIGVFVVAKS